MDSFFIFCAQYLLGFSLIIAAFFTLQQPRERQVDILIFGLCCASASYLVAVLASHCYYDPRPFVEGHFKPLIEHDAENGFPSDHTLLLSCIAAVISVFSKRTGVALWLIAILVGIARVYVGVHHPLDIITSICITVLVTQALYRTIYNQWITQISRKVYLYLFDNKQRWK